MFSGFIRVLEIPEKLISGEDNKNGKLSQQIAELRVKYSYYMKILISRGRKR